MATEIDATGWDDEMTLVHPRAVQDIPLIPPPLPARLSRVHRELDADEQWLMSLPAAARAVLEDARRVRSLEAPRLKFAVARPL